MSPKISSMLFTTWNHDSSVGIATRYGLDVPGIDSRWGVRFSATVQTCPGAHPASSTMDTGSFPGGKAAEAWHDHIPPHLARRVKKEFSYAPPSEPTWPILG